MIACLAWCNHQKSSFFFGGGGGGGVTCRPHSRRNGGSAHPGRHRERRCQRGYGGGDSILRGHQAWHGGALPGLRRGRETVRASCGEVRRGASTHVRVLRPARFSSSKGFAGRTRLRSLIIFSPLNAAHGACTEKGKTCAFFLNSVCFSGPSGKRETTEIRTSGVSTHLFYYVRVASFAFLQGNTQTG